MPTLRELLDQQLMLAQQIEQARHADRLDAIAKVRALVQRHGFTVNEVLPTAVGAVKRPSRSKARGAANS